MLGSLIGIAVAPPIAAGTESTGLVVTAEAPRRPSRPMGNFAFVARISPGGTMVDTEREGLLVGSSGTAKVPRLAHVSGQRLVVWRDSRYGDPLSFDPFFRSVFMQRFTP